MAAVLTIWLNAILSRAYNFPCPLEIIEAALGTLYIKDSSPNAYPLW